MTVEQFKRKVSQYASEGRRFLFMVDFEKQKPLVCLLHEAANLGIWYDVRGVSNVDKIVAGNRRVDLTAYPIAKDEFRRKFDQVVYNQDRGNSYLLNLTFRTPIDISLTLREIFAVSQAPYKLLYDENFVVFSPECFVKIIDGRIYTFPMKGTINASVDNAANVLIGNKKEEYEHNTIVDLMRNDLSMVSTNVEVLKYRYIETINTHKSQILQTSSEIAGILPTDWRANLGEIILRLLPAGSISGAPKEKTVEIIQEVEGQPRGYYTGVFGIFDGASLDTAVMIRFIEQSDGEMFFRSGGGITALSCADDEYQELLEKIYVPTV